MSNESQPLVRCVKVTRLEPHGGNIWCLAPLKEFDLSAEFDGAEDGESIVLTLCSMTQEAIDALPEFEGW